MEDIKTVHNPKAHRYELYVEGDLAAVADYRPSGEILVFDHTETAQRFRGRGLAARLVRYALDDVRARRRCVLPTCWFVADFIDAHPEYKDLVAKDRRRAAS